jgi:hypothetical protein
MLPPEPELEFGCDSVKQTGEVNGLHVALLSA